MIDPRQLHHGPFQFPVREAPRLGKYQRAWDRWDDSGNPKNLRNISTRNHRNGFRAESRGVILDSRVTVQGRGHAFPLLIELELSRIPAEIILDAILFDHQIDPRALHPGLI